MQLLADHEKVVFKVSNFIQVLAVHAVTLGMALWFFQWGALWFGLIVFFIFSYSMGITHHMLLSHRSFQCKKWLENLGSLLATLTWRGPFAGPVQYVAMHRVHHAYSDTEFDPHTPTKGLLHALLFWYWRLPKGFSSYQNYVTYAPDIAGDSWHVLLDRHVHGIQFLWALVCFFIGACLAPWFTGEGIFNWRGGVSYVVYGVFVKSFLVIYLGNLVDVINHRIGYRNYDTRDHSTNSAWMSLLHWGGAISWHNNHHAHPAYFTVRKKWWEFDAHRLFLLKPLEHLGLVWQVRVRDDL